jgi:hypothetical protein
MSVYVTDFSVTPWAVVHDDASGGAHSGTVDPTTIRHTTNIDGTENHNFLMVVCPVCQAVSTHPVGGGAQPASVQQMFVNITDANGCPCGQVQSTDSTALGESHVRLLVNRMDGSGRWQL